MRHNRDELIVIPEQALGGFICPRCKGVAIGMKWASHANYCPDCGQHIKINTKLFDTLKGKALTIPEDVRDSYCEYELRIGKEIGKEICGVYKNRIEDLETDDQMLPGQMDIYDFLENKTEDS